MVASDEMKELKQQVDKLRERLDFMAPMLSLLTFTQDYFQRVECEASVQLMRLKNAKLGDSAAVEGGPDKEKMDPNAVETARWLHTMTDLMIGLGGSGQARAPSAPSAVAGTPEHVHRSPLPAGSQSARPSPEPSQRHPLLHVESVPPSAEDNPAGHDGEGFLRDAQPRVSGSNRRSPPHFGTKAAPTSARSDLGTERSLRSFESLRPAGGVSLSTTASGDASARGPLGLALSPAPSDSQHRGAPQQHQGEGLGLPRGPPPGVVRGSSLENTLEFGGLALGRGTWANAYRQAAGVRRDALRLLCTSGIVTERELADDLTVISEEHIDECVSIAVEMLQRWPPEHGPPPQQEAKKFFEERLAMLYMKRAPSPFGPP